MRAENTLKAAASPQPSVIRIIGPGGAGKTTAGKLLAIKLNCNCLDLDEFFLDQHGDISDFIQKNGYLAYANQNVANYFDIINGITDSSVIVLSSGFMTYPYTVHPDYGLIRDEIEASRSTILLLPSLDINECTDIIVTRQLKRDYLNTTYEIEKARIQQRFPIFMQLNCKRLVSQTTPEEIVSKLEDVLLNDR